MPDEPNLLGQKLEVVVPIKTPRYHQVGDKRANSSTGYLTLAGSKDHGGVEGHPIRSITAQGYCCWRALTRGNHGALWTRLAHLVWNCAGSTIPN